MRSVRRLASSKRGQLYTISTEPEAKSLDEVIIGIIVVHQLTFFVFDLGSIYSYVSTYYVP